MTAQPITVAPDYAPTAPLIRLLGPLEIAGWRVPTATKPRQLLAVLASRPGQQVTVETLIDELWLDPSRIKKPRLSVETYVYHLRRDNQVEVARMPRGYALLIDPMQVDAVRFETFVQAAKRDFASGNFLAAEDALLAAKSLWRGPALGDVEHGPVLYRWAAGIEDRYRAAREAGWEIALRLGRHRDILDELRAALREDWTAEHVAQLLMTALYRSGRQVEALAVFRTVRRALIEEQGLRPCRELQRLEQQILAGGPALELEAK
jgi:SARP family transcriptional regulator, regulator of embCAB operon